MNEIIDLNDQEILDTSQQETRTAETVGPNKPKRLMKRKIHTH